MKLLAISTLSSAPETELVAVPCNRQASLGIAEFVFLFNCLRRREAEEKRAAPGTRDSKAAKFAGLRLALRAPGRHL